MATSAFSVLDLCRANKQHPDVASSTAALTAALRLLMRMTACHGMRLWLKRHGWEAWPRFALLSIHTYPAVYM